MNSSATADINLELLVSKLCRENREAEWFEFKDSNTNPDEIGQYFSALSNGAALVGESFGFLIWGVNDATKHPVGTDFDPLREKGKGNEDLIPWLRRLLNPEVWFTFEEAEIDGQRVVVAQVEAAQGSPVAFAGTRYIRDGSYKKRLDATPSLERALWDALGNAEGELATARAGLTLDEVLQYLDVDGYFRLLGAPVPHGLNERVAPLEADELVTASSDGLYTISRLGALLLADSMEHFPTVRRHALRVIEYNGTTRLDAAGEQEGRRGYAVGFQGLVDYINSRLPRAELLTSGLREDVRVYPEPAVRELVANAMIHQDFGSSGQAPLVEIFSDRLEISNPGTPLVSIDRMLDDLPRSRNEKLARLMRRFGVCEERGTGIDRVVFLSEFYQLPPPLFEETPTGMRAKLFSPAEGGKLDRSARIRATYLHACLRHVHNERLTNASLRERFGIDTKNSAQATRYINEALDAGRILLYDETAGPKHRSYIPFWATPASTDPY